MTAGLNILFLDSSEIVAVGLKQILTEDGSVRYFKHYTSIEEYKENEDYEKNVELWDVVIINPHLIGAMMHPQHELNALFSNVGYIGFISNFYERKHRNIFADFIYVTDDKATVISQVSKFKQSKESSLKEEKILSKRELEVLKCLIKGDSIKEISNKLNISNHTALTHRRNISQKIGVKSVAAMAIYAVATNIIDPQDSLQYLK